MRGLALAGLAAAAVAGAAAAGGPSSQVAWTLETVRFVASGDAARGKTLHGDCDQCHGEAGVIDTPDVPNLAGQDRLYTFKQLQDYKAKTRASAIMNDAAASLSERDMADLAAFYAAQKPARPGGRPPAPDAAVRANSTSRVPAGKPFLSEENTEGFLSIPSDMGSGKQFALLVQGDSMIGAHICPGDQALIRRQSTAENGDIVVALLNDEATIKRIFFRPDGIVLQPENPSMTPIQVKKSEKSFQIIGKVVGILRKY